MLYSVSPTHVIQEAVAPVTEIVALLEPSAKHVVFAEEPSALTLPISSYAIPGLETVFRRQSVEESRQVTVDCGNPALAVSKA